MEEKIRIHIVDDERPIVMTLEKVITKMFPSSEVTVHFNGNDAWLDLQKETKPCIIISDLNMPGLTGIQLLKKVRTEDKLKESYFLVITSSIDPETNIKTLQQGADDFLTKPFSVDQLIVKMRAAIRVVNLLGKESEHNAKLKEMEEKMEQDAENMRQQIIRFQYIRMPETTKKMDRIVSASEWIAKQLCETEKDVETVRKAAELCFCGKLGLNDKIVELPVMNKGIVLQNAMTEVPNFSRELLSKIRGMEEIDDILYHIYENMDGSGFPEQKKSWEIPLGSRILRVAIEFEELLKKNSDNPAKTIEVMFVEAKRLYDHRVLAFYDQYLGSREVSTTIGVRGREFTAKNYELDDTMMTARNIITTSGLILVGPGIKLNEEKIERIRTISKSDPILGKIYIRSR